MLFDKNTISQIVNKIASSTQAEKIFLIGSYATDRANEDSDIDLIIVKDTNEPRHKRSIEIQKLLRGTKIPVDILVYTNEEFEKEKSISFSFLSSAIQNSKLLYERN